MRFSFTSKHPNRSSIEQKEDGSSVYYEIESKSKETVLMNGSGPITTNCISINYKYNSDNHQRPSINSNTGLLSCNTNGSIYVGENPRVMARVPRSCQAPDLQQQQNISQPQRQELQCGRRKASQSIHNGSVSSRELQYRRNADVQSLKDTASLKDGRKGGLRKRGQVSVFRNMEMAQMEKRTISFTDV